MRSARDSVPDPTRAMGLARLPLPHHVPTLPPPSSRLCRLHTPQEPLGHTDVTTTMIFPHVLNRGGKGVRSLADTLGGTRSRCGLYWSVYDAGRN
jgi:hypothetical protein